MLLVTLIVDRVLRMRERESLMKKLYMVIGAFFSEVGTGLLGHFAVLDVDSGARGNKLSVDRGWDDGAFGAALRGIRQRQVRMDHLRGYLPGPRRFLVARRGFLLGLLQNQNLLEQETFTELLSAVFPLMEEPEARADATALGPADGEHIAGDIKRATAILIIEWLAYLRHLKTDYPYLFSLGVRTNPFHPGAKVEVQ